MCYVDLLIHKTHSTQQRWNVQTYNDYSILCIFGLGTWDLERIFLFGCTINVESIGNYLKDMLRTSKDSSREFSS